MASTDDLRRDSFPPVQLQDRHPVRHIHAVQYVSQPDNPWQKLRDGQPGKYEKAVTPRRIRTVVSRPRGRREPEDECLRGRREGSPVWSSTRS